MDEPIARYRLTTGLAQLAARRAAVRLREDYLRGVQKLPFAPKGVDAEYRDLQNQAMANYFGIAVNAPVQRLRADGIRTQMGDDTDRRIWTGAWQANRMDTRQTLIYRSMMLHSRGIASVWPNDAPGQKDRPIVRPESFELVHVEMDPDDPFTPLWAVKAFTANEPALDTHGVPLAAASVAKSVAVVYDDATWLRFEKGPKDREWTPVKDGTHPMRRPPFALYDYRTDATGVPWSVMDALIPQQDAINTIRFNTLLAMQFSAFRQRIVTGFDPRATDKDGNFLYLKDANGEPVLDEHGALTPILNTPGRVGVDRLLAFPGGDTHVFDLPESNLSNYIEVLNAFLVQFFSVGQIPPQYLLSQMANLSGDALAGAESTLSSLVHELQLSAGEGHESLCELAWYAMGETTPFAPSSETRWADAEARSFAQVIDAITKLVAGGFPKRAAWAMIPGATEQKLDDWQGMAEDEALQGALALASRPVVDVTPPAAAGTGGGTAPAPTQGAIAPGTAAGPA